MIKAITATVKNIATINRRIKTVANLFGLHSAEYEAFTTQVIDNLEMYETKTGIAQIRNIQANRDRYQQIAAAARKIRETPVQVLKRKADKLEERFDDYREETGDYEMKFHDYTWFSNNVTDDASEVYGLVDTAFDLGLLDICGNAEYKQELSKAFASYAYREALYNGIIDHGGEKALFSHPQINFEEFIHVVEEYTETEYDTSPYTGMMREKPDFYGDI